MTSSLSLISPHVEDFRTLSTLIQTNNRDAIIELLNHVVDACPDTNLLDFHDVEHDTALIKACVHGNLEIVQTLISFGAGINVSSFGVTPLIKAVWYNRPEVVSYLIDVGANVNQPVQSLVVSNLSPLMYATQYNRLDIITMLLVAGADVNFQDGESGNTALMLASHFGHTEAARLLLYYGSNVKLINSVSKTAFHIAQDRKSLEVVELLLWGPTHDPIEKDEDQLVYEVGLRPTYRKQSSSSRVEVETNKCEEVDEDYTIDVHPAYHTFVDFNASDSD